MTETSPIDGAATGASPLRLLAVGDCNTGGARGAPVEDRLSERLAARLKQEGLACQVQNLGYTMSTSREGLARMRCEGQPADLLLVNFGLVDAWVTSLPRLYLSYYPDNLAKRLSRKILKSAKRRLRGPLTRKFVPSGEVVPLGEFEGNLRGILNCAREREPAVQTILWGTVPVRGAEARSRNIALYNERLAAIAAQSPGTWYVDPGPLIADLPSGVAYHDHVHITRAAADRIAAAMAELYLTRIAKEPTIRARTRAA
jgi:lysophospholipase L1-like esterase